MDAAVPSRAILLGDLFRKGPGPFDMFALIEERRCEAIPGNHDLPRAEALPLHEDLDIHVIELHRWRRSPPHSTPLPLRRWLAFLTQADGWDDVPEELQHPILEDAMAVLETFKTNRD